MYPSFQHLYTLCLALGMLCIFTKWKLGSLYWEIRVYGLYSLGAGEFVIRLRIHTLRLLFTPWSRVVYFPQVPYQKPVYTFISPVVIVWWIPTPRCLSLGKRWKVQQGVCTFVLWSLWDSWNGIFSQNSAVWSHCSDACASPRTSSWHAAQQTPRHVLFTISCSCGIIFFYIFKNKSSSS